MFAKTIASVAIVGASLVAAQNPPPGTPNPITPPGLAQCQPVKITWSATKPPYYPSITKPGPPPQQVVKSFPKTSDTSLTWTVDQPEGQSFTIAIKDSTGATGYSGKTPAVGKGDDSCMKGGDNKSSSSSSSGGKNGGGGGGGGKSDDDKKSKGGDNDKKSKGDNKSGGGGGGSGKSKSKSGGSKSSSGSSSQSSSQGGQSSSGAGGAGGASSESSSSPDQSSDSSSESQPSPTSGGSSKSGNGASAFRGFPAVAAGVVGVVVAALM